MSITKKKAVAKKAVTKAAAKTEITKKVATKKEVVKSTAKKAVAKKEITKKAATKKAAVKSTAKKEVTKKAATKKEAVKAVAKKEVTKKKAVKVIKPKVIKKTAAEKKEEKLKLENQKKWEMLNKKSKIIKPIPFNINNEFQVKTPLNHSVFGWGWILNITNDRLEVIFQDKVRILLSNRTAYKKSKSAPKKVSNS